MQINAGSDDGFTGTFYTVAQVVVHPKYNHNYDYDYACVQISGKFQWSNAVKPIKLPKRRPRLNTKMVVAGWGNTGEDEEDKPNSTLRQGTMRWISQKSCKAAYSSSSLSWTDRMACAYNKGKTTLCDGDWGDAFVNKGVFYGQFIYVDSKGSCSSSALPVVLADIIPVASWVRQLTGAAFESD